MIEPIEILPGGVPVWPMSAARIRRRIDPKKLSDREWLILDAIHTYAEEHGRPPAMRELLVLAGFKFMGDLSREVDRLVATGFLERDAGVVRSLRLKVYW